jgi:hypothetical protein
VHSKTRHVQPRHVDFKVGVVQFEQGNLFCHQLRSDGAYVARRRSTDERSDINTLEA